MQTLLLLRHAHAEVGHSPGTDFDRPLSQRGLREAAAIGDYLRSNLLIPDLVLCSAAVRARETAETVLAALGASVSSRYDPRIYEASAHELITVVTEVENSVSTLLLVGHNPGMEQLLKAMTGELVAMKPCSLANLVVENQNQGERQFRLRSIHAAES